MARNTIGNSSMKLQATYELMRPPRTRSNADDLSPAKPSETYAATGPTLPRRTSTVARSTPSAGAPRRGGAATNGATNPKSAAEKLVSFPIVTEPIKQVWALIGKLAKVSFAPVRSVSPTCAQAPGVEHAASSDGESRVSAYPIKEAIPDCALGLTGHLASNRLLGFDIGQSRPRFGCRHAILPKPLKMKPHGLSDFPLCFFPGFAGCNAARQVWHISRIVGSRHLDYDRVSHHDFVSFSPACFNMLLSVPGAKSSDGLPAMVTRPGLVGCLYCRWLPRVATRAQPSASIRLMASRTFTAIPVASYRAAWHVARVRGCAARESPRTGSAPLCCIFRGTDFRNRPPRTGFHGPSRETSAHRADLRRSRYRCSGRWSFESKLAFR